MIVAARARVRAKKGTRQRHNRQTTLHFSRSIKGTAFLTHIHLANPECFAPSTLSYLPPIYIQLRKRTPFYSKQKLLEYPPSKAYVHIFGKSNKRVLLASLCHPSLTRRSNSIFAGSLSFLIAVHTPPPLPRVVSWANFNAGVSCDDLIWMARRARARGGDRPTDSLLWQKLRGSSSARRPRPAGIDFSKGINFVRRLRRD